MRGETPEQLTDAHITSRRYRIGRQRPWWTPWVSALVVLASVYALYAVTLDDTTDQVLRSLDAILRR